MTSTASATTDQESQNTGTSFTLTVTDSVTTDETETGNSITGDFTQTASDTFSTSLTESGVNAGGTFSLSETGSDAPTITITGNGVTGDYTRDQAGSQDYTLSQTNTSGANTYTLAETGTKDYSRTETGSSVTGEYSLDNSGTDSYSLHETGSDATQTFTEDVNGTDTFTLSETGNRTNGGFDRTLTASGSASVIETGVDTGGPFSVTSAPTPSLSQVELGNYLDGSLSRTETGTDRYSLLEQFNNVSNATGDAPGNVDFSPVGLPFRLGQAPAPPTGGGSYPSGAFDVQAQGSMAAGGVGSQAPGVRGLEGIGIMGYTAGHDLSGAASQAVFAEMGSELEHEYCFAAGTMVRTQEGFKRIEQMQPGDLVAAVSDRDPLAPVEYRLVEQVYHNKPARLLNLHVGELVIRTTLNHPFFVEGKGWLAAWRLMVGDRLRTLLGAWLPITEVFDNGDVEPVYNLRVAEHHTYFVGDEGAAVLAHNTSVEARPETEAEASERRKREGWRETPEESRTGGGYSGGWLNPFNWRRGLYTGYANASDELYEASGEGGGKSYRRNAGLTHQALEALTAVPGAGVLAGGTNAVLTGLEGEHLSRDLKENAPPLRPALRGPLGIPIPRNGHEVPTEALDALVEGGSDAVHKFEQGDQRFERRLADEGPEANSPFERGARDLTKAVRDYAPLAGGIARAAQIGNEKRERGNARDAVNEGAPLAREGVDHAAAPRDAVRGGDLQWDRTTQVLQDRPAASMAELKLQGCLSCYCYAMMTTMTILPSHLRNG